MNDNEKRCAIKFCFRLGHNATETFAKLQQAYGDSVLSRAHVFRWFKAFSEGRESIEDESRSGRPSDSKTAENVNHLKGHHFGTLEYIQTAVTVQLKAIPIYEFHQCYEEWKKRLQRCVASAGSYLEGDIVVEFCQVIYSQFGLAIHQNDHQARRRFVEWAQNEIAVVPDFHKRILFSDEAHFWLNGYVNKQNCRICSEANPQVYGGRGSRVELWFQQDGATCHTARAPIDLLKDTFVDRLISRFGPVNWPPRSCDLTPLDYFLWGYVKSLVYAVKPQTLDHLEDNIRGVIADIRQQMLEKVIENWTSRLDYIRASRGSPMPEIIFKM
ncbi:putative transposable element [Trichonephila clavipes]|nr:putative transposable element [Trichonephila clavipes]